MKPVHCLAATAALCLSVVAHAAIPAPAPAERLVVAEAGKRAAAQPALPQTARSQDDAAAKPREAKPRSTEPGEFDFTLYWYN